MSSAGFSEARLSRMHDIMASYVERGQVTVRVILRGQMHTATTGRFSAKKGG